MKLSSAFVGSPLKEYTCIITARRIMNYAAAIGDANPLYFNDERPEGIIAPPLFPVAVTWPIVENITDYLDAPEFPQEVLFTQVHYSEHLSIHRPVKPGSHLTIRGVIAAIEPHRAGTYVITRFDAHDTDGNHYFTEHIGAMMRGVACEDTGKGGQSVPSVPEQTKESAALWESVIPIDPLAPFIYDGCTNIYFPIHTSVQFAHQVGLPGIIHQGTATLALAVHSVLNREAGGDPHRVATIYCRFSGMVLPGSVIRVCLTGKNQTSCGTDLFFTVFNAEEKRAISDGYIQLKD
ncbi:MAG: MaoC/PaaZ C-terminal domain-containing protein [Smithellaceae bacterium]|nr:MaoC/PaaZ C-terminal domain-containing protein [Smithellaceae bacterium]